MFKSFAAMKGFLLFWLTFFAMAVCSIYAYYKTDKVALDALPLLLGIYATHSFGKQASAHWASSKDDTSDTAKVIENVKES